MDSLVGCHRGNLGPIRVNWLPGTPAEANPGVSPSKGRIDLMSQDPGSARPGQGSEPVDRQGVPKRRGGLVPPRGLLVFLLVCAVLVSVFWCTVPWGDSAVSNIVVLIVGFSRMMQDEY